MAPKPKKKIDIMPRPTKAEQARAVAQQKAYDAFKKTEKSRQYNPAPMSAAAKKKAAAAGKATAKKTAPKSTASKVGAVAGKVAKRVKTVAREVRDVKTAVGTTAKAFTKTGSNPNQPYSAKKQSIKNLATQIREVGRAAAKGKPGTSSGKVVMGKETNLPTGVSKGKKRK
jgi:hypothetical protein